MGRVRSLREELGRREVFRNVVAALLSLSAIVLVSVAVAGLDSYAPVLSLGVLYLFAVLPVAAIWGLAFAIPVSIVSMLTFNWFFLPPTHTFRLADSENWVALAVYLVTAVIVSELSARARRRAEEADLRRREAERAMEDARASEERRMREALEAEALRRSEAAKTAVLRAVSHDLRSPITALTTASEVLAGTPELADDERAELVESILSQARRLERLVEDLLALSRLEAGAATPGKEVWTVDGLLARALETVSDSDRVRIDIAGDAPSVDVDPGQIERALVNVLENALRFSPVDEPVVVSFAEFDAEVRLAIDDHGPGVPAHERERIFEPFVRGESLGGRGSGLGLAIARGFVTLNGGRLWVEGRDGGGARFVLALPTVALPVEVHA